MTVLLLLATFLAFALIDYLLHRKQMPKPAVEAEAAAGETAPTYVDGFHTPENLRYHPGHTWVLQERRQLVRVGVDEFAAALAGRIDAIELPKPGTWVRQGQRIFSVTRSGERTELVSPIEGEIASINPDIAADPSVLRSDPYGKGWLMTVTVPDEETTMRNLVPVTMVRSWMRDSLRRLYAIQPQFAGATAYDGGRPAEDLLTGIPDASWTAVTREFFLS